MSTTEPDLPPPASSLAGRLANVVAAPGEVFHEIKERPVVLANWLVPAALVIVLSWISVAVIYSQDFPMRQIQEMQEQAFQQAFQQQVEKGKMTQQQADQMKQTRERMQGITALATKVSAFVAAPFGVAQGLFLWALAIWLMGKKLIKPNTVSSTDPPGAAVQNSFEYMKAVEVVGLAMVVDALGVILKTLVILIKGNIFATPSLALLVEFNPANPLHSSLAVVNVMTIWSLAVMAIGLARVARASFLKCATWIFGIWLAFTGAIIGGSLLFATLMSHLIKR